MGKKLAIKGDSTRGEEVIKLLEMLGGNNRWTASGGLPNLYYFISNDCIIYSSQIEKDVVILTLEEFLEKYPYKVGDKVVYEDDNDIVVISEIKWDNTVGDIFYNVKRIVEDDCFLCPPELLKPYKETKMNKKLAIKGHPTRGKEVIELLTMMGGRDVGVLKGNHDYYVIDECENNLIKFYEHNYIRCHEFVVFTLEEFLKKYPFKVGDKVVYTKFGDNCDDYPVTIESMKWMGTTIEYTFNDCVTCLAKDLKMWNGEPDAVISGIHLNSCDYADEVELNLGDYEIEVRDGKTYAVKKKPKYPKTYKECCDVLLIPPYYNLRYHTYQHGYYEYATSNCLLSLQDKLNTLGKLLICRNAYWKLAGEEMGLGKPWKPDWLSGRKEEKYCIVTQNNEIWHNFSEYGGNEILAFPTEEMRDVFYENFKELIESCKELL